MELVRALSAGIAAFAFSAAVFAGEPPPPQASNFIDGRIARISDGDTIAFQPDSGGKQIKVRLVGIDTPELHFPIPGGGNGSQGPLAQKAADRLAELAPAGATGRIEAFGTDSYGRTLGRIWIGGRDINLQLVEEGWASVYIICSGRTCQPGFLEAQNVEAYLSACTHAVNAGLGIFNPEDPLEEQPFEYRARLGNRPPSRPVGDIADRSLRAPSAYREVPLCSRVFFGSVAEGHKLGFQE